MLDFGSPDPAEDPLISSAKGHQKLVANSPACRLLTLYQSKLAPLKEMRCKALAVRTVNIHQILRRPSSSLKRGFQIPLLLKG